VASGSDQRLRAVSNGSVAFDEPLEEGALKQVLLSHNNKTLFYGTDRGDVLLRNFPLKTQEAPFLFPVHLGAVQRMSVTHDDTILFTVGDDGVLWMFEQSPTDRRGPELPVPVAERPCWFQPRLTRS
jgi:hypothetical protein